MNQENNNSATLSWEKAEELIGKKVRVQFHSIKNERVGYLIDVYNPKNPFIVLELGFEKYEDRKLSQVKSYQIVS